MDLGRILHKLLIYYYDHICTSFQYFYNIRFLNLYLGISLLDKGISLHSRQKEILGEFPEMYTARANPSERWRCAIFLANQMKTRPLPIKFSYKNRFSPTEAVIDTNIKVFDKMGIQQGYV